MTLLDLLRLFRKHLKLIIILPIICALAVAAASWAVLPDQYTSSASVYVLSKSSYKDESALTDDELNASQKITNDVAQLIVSDRVCDDVARSLNLSSLSGYDINVENTSGTRIITISVTGTSAHEIAIIANKLAASTDKVAQEVMDVQSVNLVDEAKEPSSPSGPPRTNYTLIAFLVGLALAVVIVILSSMFDTRIHNPEEIAESLDLPVIGRIPTI